MMLTVLIHNLLFNLWNNYEFEVLLLAENLRLSTQIVYEEKVYTPQIGSVAACSRNLIEVDKVERP